MGPSAVSQTITNEAIGSSGHSVQRSQTPSFFPHNWIRGYTDFSVAPSHNEPDLGRCMFPQPASAGGTTSTCTDRKSTRLNSSHGYISYAVFCLKKKKKKTKTNMLIHVLDRD